MPRITDCCSSKARKLSSKVSSTWRQFVLLCDFDEPIHENAAHYRRDVILYLRTPELEFEGTLQSSNFGLAGRVIASPLSLMLTDFNTSVNHAAREKGAQSQAGECHDGYSRWKDAWASGSMR